MSHPQKYSASKDFSKEQLETWINQTEDLDGKLTAIEADVAAQKTVGTFDFDIPKPSEAHVAMGHIPVGSDPIMGQAYILGQVMDVTVHR